MNCSENSPYFNALAFFPGCYEGAAEGCKPLEFDSSGDRTLGSTRHATAARKARVGEVLRRLPSTEDMEPLFSKLRGVDLILATLAYGLKVRVSDLRAVRVRDVNLANRCIVIGGVLFALPAVVIDDIRDFIHEKLCGSEASVTVSRREQRLFSEEDFQSFFEQASEIQHNVASVGEGDSAVLTERCLNRIFRVLGRFHAKKAIKRGAKIASPLELFDKGPRIVRRGRWGVIDAYYIWRTAYLPALG